MSGVREEKDEISWYIKYIKFIRYYDKFHELKYKTKDIARHKVILKYLTK